MHRGWQNRQAGRQSKDGHGRDPEAELGNPSSPLPQIRLTLTLDSHPCWATPKALLARAKHHLRPHPQEAASPATHLPSTYMEEHMEHVSMGQGGGGGKLRQHPYEVERGHRVDRQATLAGGEERWWCAVGAQREVMSFRALSSSSLMALYFIFCA